nr:MAG TPA: hypothetical protein [Caudoviricetes sp.]
MNVHLLPPNFFIFSLYHILEVFQKGKKSVNFQT